MSNHKSPQRYFVADGKVLYGTNSLKGFTILSAERRAERLNKLNKTKRFKVMEVLSVRAVEPSSE